MINKIISVIGENGPFLLFILSILLLINNTQLLIYNIVGGIVNVLFNLFLKGLFKQPRPYEDMKKFDIMVQNGKRFIYKDGIPYDLFGMPSTHAQTVLFYTMYCFLAIHNYSYLFFFFISILTLYQRVIDKHHSYLQVFIGGLIGAIVAYIFYHLSKTYSKKDLVHKKDDNCKINYYHI